MKKILFLLLVLSGVAVSATYELPAAEPIQLKTADGLVLAGSYYPAESTSNAAVIMLHMLGRNRGDWNSFARYLQKDGISVLTVDLRGHGSSINYLQRIYWRYFDQNGYKKMVEDLVICNNFLVEQKKINPARIGLLGMNIGSSVALLYAAQNTKIASAVLISPGLNYKGLEIADALTAWGERPLYLICSKTDVNSYSSCQTIQRLAKGKVKLAVYSQPGSGITLFNDVQELRFSIEEWYKVVLLNKNQTYLEP